MNRYPRPIGPEERIRILYAPCQAYAAGTLARREGVPYWDRPNPIAVLRYRAVHPK